MQEQTASPVPEPADAAPTHARTFLVVVDKTPEMKVALAYACERAINTHGRIALLYIIEPEHMEISAAVEKLIEEEKRQEGERLLDEATAQVTASTGADPLRYMRKGKPAEELVRLVADEPGISVLVMGAGAGPDGLGPLLTHLLSGAVGRFRVPVMVVPGTITIDQIKDLGR
jgi:nucleotide-binding universal stress UspA family protein